MTDPVPPCYAIGGVTADPGGPSIAGAVAIAPNSVTFPTLGVATVDPVISGLMGTSGVAYNHVWHKFTPSQSGQLIFDVLLSYPSTGVEDQSNTNPSARIEFYRSDVGASPTSGADLTHLFGQWTDSTFFSRKRGRITYNVTAGTTYLIALWSPSTTAGSLYFVFRMSNYGAVTSYTQTSDESWVLRSPTGVAYSWHYADTVPVQYQYGYVYSLTNYDPYNRLVDTPVAGPAWGTNFHGSYQMDRSFAGPAPAGDGGALDCSWHHGRLGAWGSQWWSKNPLGPNPASWNGTDPYNPGVAGYGTCLTHTGQVESGNGFPGTVGCRWHANSDTINQETDFHSFAATNRLWVRHTVDQFGPDAGRGNPTDTPGGGATLEWESNRPAILGVDVSPDELADGTYAGGSGDPLKVQWHVKAVGYTNTDVNPTDIWGPHVYTDYSGYKAEGWLGGDGLGSFPASQSQQLPDFTNRSTDDLTWTAVDSGVLSAVLAYEDAWQTQWDAGTDTGNISFFAGGLRLTALYPEMFSDTRPPLDYTWSSGTVSNASRYRTGQAAAFQLRLRPARHRWTSPPTLPVVELCTTARLRIQPRDDAENAGTAYRTFPPQHQSIRVYGGYPGGPGN